MGETNLKPNDSDLRNEFRRRRPRICSNQINDTLPNWEKNRIISNAEPTTGSSIRIADAIRSYSNVVVGLVSDEEHENDEDGFSASTPTTCSEESSSSNQSVHFFDKRKRRRRRRRNRRNKSLEECSGNVSNAGTCTKGPKCLKQAQFKSFYDNPEPAGYQCLAMDCEMVGTGTDGNISLLARVTIVNWDGNVILDQYVRPETGVVITDYRTDVSGIKPEHLYCNSDNNIAGNSVISCSTEISHLPVVDIETCRRNVQSILFGDDQKPDPARREVVLIGHGLKNDLEALGIQYPWHLIRDTAKYEPFMRTKTMTYNFNTTVSCNEHNNNGDTLAEMNSPETKRKKMILDHQNVLTKEVRVPRKLKELCLEYLNGMTIQQKEHSSYEDAVAALCLYKKVQYKWEKVMEYKIQKTASIVSLQ